MNRLLDIVEMAIADQNPAAPCILLLEDSALDAELVSEQLNAITPRPVVHRVERKDDYIAAIADGRFDIILSDFSLPDFDGMAALDIARKSCPETPFIFVSGVLGEEAAIESFRRGATDYILKQRLIRLPAAVERALAEADERRERRRAEEQREILVRELSHRVKNTMAMVMSIVRRTARSSSSVDGYAESLLQRLDAMAQAHALLFQSNWDHVRLSDLVARMVEAHDGERRFLIDGSDSVHLRPKSALALSMVLNELIANAAKYGALSNQEGQISIRWRQQPHGPDGAVLDIEWKEHAGPIVVAPQSGGFGTTLIERSIEYELDGEIDLQYPADGLGCRMRFPI